MRIATFGSCLSRWTADKFSYAVGGRVVSCVYHNRSDQFLHHFVDRNTQELRLEHLLSLCNISPDNKEHFSEAQILANQCRTHMGKHLLQTGQLFLEALTKNSLDVILMDNFMDLTARVSEDPHTGSKFFSRNRSDLLQKEIIDPIHAAKNYSRIIDFIAEQSPQTKVIFNIFPYNTYGQSEKKEWTESFSNAFRPRRGTIVFPPATIPSPFQGDVPSHFKDSYYFVYAGMVQGALNF